VHLITVSAFSLVVPKTNITKTIKGIYMKLEIKVNTVFEVEKWVEGTTQVFNTDDYTELKGKTLDEIKQMDVTTLLKLKTKDGRNLVDTMEYEDDNAYTTLDVDYDYKTGQPLQHDVTDIDLDGWDTEIEIRG
jgi:hypothetical protein